MKRINLLLTMVGLVFVILGCSNQDKATEYDFVASDSSRSISSMEEEMEVEESLTDETVVSDDFYSETRMVIHHGHMVIEVKDYLKAKNEIQAKVQSTGGYIVESYYNEDMEGQLTGSLVVHIPKQDFQSLFEHLANQKWKVLEQQTVGNDVTEEFVDLESRLKAKRVVEERLLGFMNSADNTENLLKISKELASVQAEIEQMIGRKNYIENQVEFSTVSIHLQENNLTASIQGENLNTWERSQKLFIETINAIIKVSSSGLVFIIGLSPILVPFVILLGAVLLFKKQKRREK